MKMNVQVLKQTTVTRVPFVQTPKAPMSVVVRRASLETENLAAVSLFAVNFNLHL